MFQAGLAAQAAPALRAALAARAALVLLAGRAAQGPLQSAPEAPVPPLPQAPLPVRAQALRPARRPARRPPQRWARAPERRCSSTVQRGRAQAQERASILRRPAPGLTPRAQPAPAAPAGPPLPMRARAPTQPEPEQVLPHRRAGRRQTAGPMSGQAAQRPLPQPQQQPGQARALLLSRTASEGRAEARALARTVRPGPPEPRSRQGPGRARLPRCRAAARAPAQAARRTPPEPRCRQDSGRALVLQHTALQRPAAARALERALLQQQLEAGYWAPMQQPQVLAPAHGTATWPALQRWPPRVPRPVLEGLPQQPQVRARESWRQAPWRRPPLGGWRQRQEGPARGLLEGLQLAQEPGRVPATLLLRPVAR